MDAFIATQKDKSNIFNVVSKLSSCSSNDEEHYFKETVILSLPEILEGFYASKNTNVVTAFVCHCHEGVVQKAALQLCAHNEISVSFNMKQKG